MHNQSRGSLAGAEAAVREHHLEVAGVVVVAARQHLPEAEEGVAAVVQPDLPQLVEEAPVGEVRAHSLAAVGVVRVHSSAVAEEAQAHLAVRARWLAVAGAVEGARAHL